MGRGAKDSMGRCVVGLWGHGVRNSTTPLPIEFLAPRSIDSLSGNLRRIPLRTVYIFERISLSDSPNAPPSQRAQLLWQCGGHRALPNPTSQATSDHASRHRPMMDTVVRRVSEKRRTGRVTPLSRGGLGLGARENGGDQQSGGDSSILA